MTLELKNYISIALKLILIISILNSIYNSLWHIMSANIFLLILLFLPQILKRSIKLTIPIGFEILLFIFTILTLFLGNVGGILAPISFGIAVSFIGFLILLILYKSNQIKKNYPLILLFSFNLTMTFAVGLELLKFYLKLALGHELSSGLYLFSMMTLSYVLIGAVISTLIGLLYMTKKFFLLTKIVGLFVNSNPNLFKKENSSEEIVKIIEKGESEKMEFKSTLRYNLYTDQIDKNLEHSVLKSLVGFLNSEGGTLLIGVSDKKEIVGIEHDKFSNSDKFLLHLTNMIKEKIGRNLANRINIRLIDINGKGITEVYCKKSSVPVFLKSFNGEEFYVRSGPSTIKIEGSELIEYVKKSFKKEN